MKQQMIFIFVLILLHDCVSAQKINRIDTIKKVIPTALTPAKKDSLIKQELTDLAFKNPNVAVADANIRIAEYELNRAKTSWLGSVSAGANINEFVIKNSAAASFFPKYNLGITVPFNIFSKVKTEKQIAQQNIIINKEFKNDRLRILKAEVLSLYEVYKEKIELLRLQKISMDEDYQAYLTAQKDYADGNIEMNEMSKVYKSYIAEQGSLVTKEKEVNIAVLQLEALIGIPLYIVLQKYN